MKTNTQIVLIIQDINPATRFNNNEYYQKILKAFPAYEKKMEILIIPMGLDCIEYIQRCFDTFGNKKRFIIVTSPMLATTWENVTGTLIPVLEKAVPSTIVAKNFKRGTTDSEKIIWIVRDKVLFRKEDDPSQGHEYVDFFVSEPRPIQSESPIRLLNMLDEEEFIPLVHGLMEPEREFVFEKR